MNILNWLNGAHVQSMSDQWIEKYNPHTGELLSLVTSSNSVDVSNAVDVAASSFSEWSQVTPVARGQKLNDLANLMQDRSAELQACIAEETGKPPSDAKGEVGGAIAVARYFAGEGMRLYGRSLTSGMPGKHTHSVRAPVGVAGLIVPANTPIANIAWKVFPALICGNSVVLKASEDAPRTAILFAELTAAAGLPDGVFNVIQGNGKDAGQALVEDGRVGVISFTGSTSVGIQVARLASDRVAKVSLELGGKNPFVVCDDADLPEAVRWGILSGFSNAGQRCAAGSRFLIFEDIYEDFVELFLEEAGKLTLGVSEGSDLGPLISKRQQATVLESIEVARREGGRISLGGGAPSDGPLSSGYYVLPTVIEDLDFESSVCGTEIFGPVVTFHTVDDLTEAVSRANDSPFGLTAAIHTKSTDRAMYFAERVRAGTVNVNIGTYGSEPHMPFGGFGLSGNGTREPGVEALDVYSELKNISLLTRSHLL